jgi:hypothetical protein
VMTMSNPMDRSEVAELRFQEQSCIARVTSIKRKLACGSKAVEISDLMRWEQTLGQVHAKLILRGEVPNHPDPAKPLPSLKSARRRAAAKSATSVHPIPLGRARAHPRRKSRHPAELTALSD